MTNAPKLLAVLLTLVGIAGLAGLNPAEGAPMVRLPKLAVVEECSTSATWHVPSAEGKASSVPSKTR